MLLHQRTTILKRTPIKSPACSHGYLYSAKLSDVDCMVSGALLRFVFGFPFQISCAHSLCRCLETCWFGGQDIRYGDVIMGTIASQITSLTIVCSTVYSGADQRTHQSSASLAFVRGIHRGPVNPTHKGPVTRKCFHLMTSSRFVLFLQFVCVYMARHLFRRIMMRWSEVNGYLTYTSQRIYCSRVVYPN